EAGPLEAALGVEGRVAQRGRNLVRRALGEEADPAVPGPLRGDDVAVPPPGEGAAIGLGLAGADPPAPHDGSAGRGARGAEARLPHAAQAVAVPAADPHASASGESRRRTPSVKRRPR